MERISQSVISGSVLVLVFACSALLIAGCGKTDKQPDIFLLTVDTARADHFSYAGYARLTTPNLDKLADDSLVFTRAYSASSFTDPSFSCIMSGFLPHETKVYSNKHALPDKVLTLAEILKQQGYVTGAVVSNYALRSRSGFSQGFDYYNDEMTDENRTNHLPERVADNTTSAALEWLRQNRKEKIFFWVHYQDPHGPYTPPLPYDGMFLHDGHEGEDATLTPDDVPAYQLLGEHRSLQYYIAQHDAEINFFDKEIGKLIDKIRSYGLYDKSLIIFTSDHGESLGERPFKLYHGINIYRELIHVPLIIHWDKHTGRVDTPVHHWDLIPTVRKVLGLEPGQNLRGRNLLAGTLDLVPLFGHAEEFLSMIVQNLHLIYDTHLKEFEFYVMSKDPAEQENEIDNPSYANDIEKMKLLMNQIIRQDFLGVEDELKDTDPLFLEKLASLGYIN